MPVTISSPKFSLVRFDGDKYTLPATTKFDSAFQFVVNGDLPITNNLRLGVINNSGFIITSAFSSDVFAVPIDFIQYLSEDNYNAFADFYLISVTIGTDVTTYNLQVTKEEFRELLLEDYGYVSIGDSNNKFYDNGDGETITISFQQAENPGGGPIFEVVTFSSIKLWWKGYVMAPGELIGSNVPIGSCFKYVIIDETAGIIISTSNNFKVYKESKWLSILSYTNNEDAFDFVYPGSELNIQLVPFFLSKPQWPQKKSVYNYSNGGHKLLSATVEKQYQLKADFMPQLFHEGLTIAFSHDYVKIECNNIEDSPVTIVSQDNYSVDWDEEDDGATSAQGKGLLTVATFGFRNDNFE